MEIIAILFNYLNNQNNQNNQKKLLIQDKKYIINDWKNKYADTAIAQFILVNNFYDTNNSKKVI